MNTLVQGQIKEQQPQPGSPPVAATGPDQIITEGDSVTLIGTKSFNPDGKIVSYVWGVEALDDESPSIALDGQNAPVARFIAPKVVGNVDSSSYLFELTVTDNEGLTGSNASKVVVVKK